MFLRMVGEYGPWACLGKGQYCFLDFSIFRMTDSLDCIVFKYVFNIMSQYSSQATGYLPKPLSKQWT